MRLVPLLVLIATAAPALAQPLPGTCALGRGEGVLDVGDVRASVFNTGSLFYGNTTTGGDGYIVPRGSGHSAVYAASLWLGGTVGGQLRTAASLYHNFVFRPGPLGDGGTAPADCAPYDRIYTVARADVAAYVRTGVPTADLRDWPWRLGAPVLDGDGDLSNYDLAAGDQPAIRGEQMAWWLMNDSATLVGDPNATPRTPLGVEVRAEAFAFAAGPLAQTTVYRYTVTNRSAAPIDSAYAGIFVDSDLGDAVDDYVGSDTLSGLAYTYNADNADAVYGVPPAVGIQVLSGPAGLPNGRDDDRDGSVDEPGERLRATAMPLITKGPNGPTMEPLTPEAYSFRLRGRWNDGRVMRERGIGYGEPSTVPVTTFAYSGDPVRGRSWSEVNTGTQPQTNASGDKRMAVASGPFRLAPGQTDTVVFAIPFGQGTSNLGSVTELRRVATALRNAYGAGYFEAVRVGGTSSAPVDQAVRLSAPSPNPFTVRAVVRYEMPAGTPLRATLHDVLGRRIAVLADGPTTSASGEIAVDGRRLAPGVYRVRVSVPAGERVVTLIRAR